MAQKTTPKRNLLLSIPILIGTIGLIAFMSTNQFFGILDSSATSFDPLAGVSCSTKYRFDAATSTAPGAGDSSLTGGRSTTAIPWPTITSGSFVGKVPLDGLTTGFNYINYKYNTGVTGDYRVYMFNPRATTPNSSGGQAATQLLIVNSGKTIQLSLWSSYQDGKRVIQLQYSVFEKSTNKLLENKTLLSDVVSSAPNGLYEIGVVRRSSKYYAYYKLGSTAKFTYSPEFASTRNTDTSSINMRYISQKLSSSPTATGKTTSSLTSFGVKTCK